jgi:DNA polymerase-3 subunit alpha
MKIKKITPLNNGLTKEYATKLWSDINGFAAYSFNKSHAVEYSVISFWTMWLKVHHPVAFFAACLTVLKEDKWAGLIKDAAAHDILVLPPDLNISTDRYEIVYDKARGKDVLYMPFQAIKGVSEKGSASIIEARKTGAFKDWNDFFARVNKRVVNKRVQEALIKVGASASVDPTQKDILHPERLKDQKVLLGDLMNASVKADRAIDVDSAKPGLIALYEEVNKCSACSLAGQCHPMPKFGKKPKFMMVFDSPNYSEDDKGEMMAGDASKYTKEALKSAGLQISDGYYTALVKSKKPKGGKLDNDMINGCSDFLRREVELLKPAVIVAMGSASIRHFAPDVKGGWAELLGQSYYDAKLDATVLFGMNPSMVYMDSSKQRLVDQVAKQLFDLVT